MAQNFKLIVITPEKDVAEEAEILSALLEAGLQSLHIRKPTHTIEQTKDLLNAIPAIFHPRIVLHGHYSLLNSFNLKGVHLPENIRKAGYANEIKNIVSTSYHVLEDIPEEKSAFEYAFYSPVFQSISKKNYKPTLEKNKIGFFLENNKDKIRFKVIALGGITDKNIMETVAMGFDGAACMGYIWESPDPVTQFKKLAQIVSTSYR